MNNNYYFIILLIFILIIISYNKEFFINISINYPIKKISPQIILNPNADIAFVYVYTHNIFPYAKHSILNILY